MTSVFFVNSYTMQTLLLTSFSMSISIPTTYEQLKKQMRLMGFSTHNMHLFQDEIDDAEHDIESIKEDISDREQSMLLDFFRDELNDEKIFDVVKSIMENVHYM